MSEHHYPTVTGVILAGGQARRMGGEDKGLVLYQQRPLVSYAIAAMKVQVDKLIINANRNIDQYKSFGYTVISDSIEGFQGPLAGMLTAIQATDTDFILTSPCDCPNLSTELRRRMLESLLLTQSDIAVATDGDRMQPVFCLIRCSLKHDLEKFLIEGGRKIDLWLTQHKLVEVDFSDQKETFVNFNHREDLQQLRPVKSPLPMLGFSAFSGTGKTTLLTRLLPKLNQRGIRIAVIKHAHHNFDIDKPGKDSYQIREAGAQQMLIASSKMMALMHKKDLKDSDPKLSELLPRLDISQLDLILVEGFKHEIFPKIELHRPSVGKPLLFVDDPHIIAIASDEPISSANTLDQLDINDVDGIADYVEHFMQKWTP